MSSQSYPAQLNPFVEDATSKKDNRRSWNPRKMFLSRHKRTSSYATAQITTDENVERELIPPTDEQVPQSHGVHRKMSRDTTPTESKCRTNDSTLHRKKRRAPLPPLSPVTLESSSSTDTKSITDLSFCDTIEGAGFVRFTRG
ncbi:uncharacterized protein LOC130693196 isoform X2 [Daphnia carinata]|uniref:uncharacterized protein LOC130693196 isoform X2 n=1 Tax=Daphnia carinata TaxID=120202 RepID=UPI0028685481|nr:uncharacterized protein LOC130693196 isoform X2 [Daphnia carinata]